MESGHATDAFLPLLPVRALIAEAEKDKATDEYTKDRLRELSKFFETTTAWYAQVRRWPTATLLKFMKAGDRVLKVLGLSG